MFTPLCVEENVVNSIDRSALDKKLQSLIELTMRMLFDSENKLVACTAAIKYLRPEHLNRPVTSSDFRKLNIEILEGLKRENGIGRVSFSPPEVANFTKDVIKGVKMRVFGLQNMLMFMREQIRGDESLQVILCSIPQERLDGYLKQENPDKVFLWFIWMVSGKPPELGKEPPTS